MTKRRVARALAEIREEVASELPPEERADLAARIGASGLDPAPTERDTVPAAGEVSVEWEPAKPETRPTGIAWDPTEATLTYDLWEAQHECLDALTDGDADIVAFLGGYGTGKSIVGARWLIAQALAHPGSRFLAMGRNFQQARHTTYRVLFEQLPGDTAMSHKDPDASPIVADYNRSDNRLTLHNGTVIMLGSGDNWRRYAGDEFGAIWLDEPSLYAADLHDLLEMLGGRLRGVDGPKVQCWTLTGNGYNDAWEIIEKQQDSTGDPIGFAIACVQASTLANPYLEPGTIANLKRQFEGTAREDQALRGEFAAKQGLVYSMFQRGTHVLAHTDACDRIEDDWRLYGYDAGWRDPMVILELGRTSANQLVVIDEFHETAAHVEAAIEWLESAAKPRGKMFAEHNPADLAKFRRAGYHVRNAAKDIRPGIADVGRRLRTDENGRVGLFVSAQCEYLIREFLDYEMDDVGTSRATDHCLDALRYAVHGIDEGRRIDSWEEPNQDFSPILVSGKVDDGYL